MEHEMTSSRFISNLTKNTVALILAGGRGERLKDLTEFCSKPAVPSVVNSVLLIFRFRTVLIQVFAVLELQPNTSLTA